MKKELSVTQIMVTHDMNSAYAVADKIAMLYKGNIIFYGTPDEIKQSQDERIQHFIQGIPSKIEI